MSMITIQKSELVELENQVKEKNKRIKKLEGDNLLLVGLNHFNGCLLLKSLLEGMAQSRDIIAFVSEQDQDPERSKTRPAALAVMDTGIKLHKIKLNLATIKAKDFCRDNAETVQVLMAKFKVDLPGVIGGCNV